MLRFRGSSRICVTGIDGYCRKSIRFHQGNRARNRRPHCNRIRGLGSNSVQNVPINIAGVTQVCLYLLGEGAVTELSFCAPLAGDSLLATSPPMVADIIPLLAPSNSSRPSATPTDVDSLSPSLVPSNSQIPSVTPSRQLVTEHDCKVATMSGTIGPRRLVFTWISFLPLEALLPTTVPASSTHPIPLATLIWGVLTDNAKAEVQELAWEDDRIVLVRIANLRVMC